MEIRDYMTALTAEIRRVSTNRRELDILKWITATTAELHGVTMFLRAQLAENTIVALHVHTYESPGPYRSFQDNLNDAHIEVRAREIAPLLDAMPAMSDADGS